ncbi:serine hydrolase domain-containing protein [Carboxylicivirga mesophila]|nr:serine hydrolase domain-containing protein [Carboxylicivirga mesophila]
MNKPIIFIALTLLLSCSNNQTGNFSVSIERSHSYIEGFMESHKVPGMQIAVSHKGSLVWSQSFGYSNLEQSTPVHPETKFRIASVSKSVSAVLTARLYQNRIVDIDQAVNDKLACFQHIPESFTVRQLFCHAAGIRHYLPKDTSGINFHHSIQTGLNILKDDSLLFAPGHKFHYSSYGYNIAAAYIEKQTNLKFEKLLKDSLFVPLNMNNSIADHPYQIIPNRTSGYELNTKGEIINAHFFDNRYKIPSGGILSCAEDLTKICNELQYGTYLNNNSQQLLFTPYKYSGENESDTGFGWVVTKDEHGNRLYGHLGGITGGCSAIMLYPDLELSVIWLGNLDADWSAEPTITIANFFIDEIQRK